MLRRQLYKIDNSILFSISATTITALLKNTVSNRTMDFVESHQPVVFTSRIQRGGGGGKGPGPPLKSQKIGFLCNTGPDPLKTTKLPSQHSMLGHHLPASETPFRRRFTVGPMMAQLKRYLDPLSHTN